MVSPDGSARVTDALIADFVRDPLAVPEAVAGAFANLNVGLPPSS